ncbi:M16 family metallopeptidase [Kordiimonas aquimaris]|uniref:M16 family metallopeptidase n=1 Tax=Kordiimonas aquimaris TaxID=707591 RepID=UPI0021D0C6A8|nr:pitrilysin family protein [Kordiimonas aquimaris]
MKIRNYVAGIAAFAALSACDVQVSEEGNIEPEAETGLDIEVHVPFEKFTLDNGLRVVVHEDRKAPVVAVSVWYHVGSKDEPEGKTGFAHLFEHLMFNGSENYDDEFFGPFEAVGATNLNGTTWFDRTNYFANVPTPALDMALWMESDRMGHLLGAVTQEKLDNQIGVVQNEKRQGDNAPYGMVEYSQLEGLFPVGHPYRHSTIGSMEDLSNASLEDVKNWFRQYYGAANTVIVLAGDIDAETAKPLMEKYFGDIDAGPALTRHKAWVPTRTSNTVEDMVDQSAPQVRLYRSWAVAPRTTYDAAMLNVAAEVLGGGKNSRMYQALVYQNPLAVNVTVQMQPFELASLFNVEVTLQPGVDEAKVEELVNLVMAEFLAEGPTVDELQRAKTGIIASQVRGIEQIGGFGGKATALAQAELYAGDAGHYAKSIDWINNAPADDIQAAANNWLEQGYYQLTVRPYPKYQTTTSTVDRSTGIPQVGSLPDLTFPAIEEGTLANGMKVVVANRPTVPVVSTALQFDAGYAADAGRPLGTASFALAMLDEGTASKTALEIAAETERLGANLSTGSNLDMSTVNLSALKPNLDASLALAADVVRNPAFAQDEIDRLKSRWVQTIAQEKAQPVQLALRTLPPLLYGDGHSYSVPLTGSGTVAAIEGMTRDDLTKFHNDWIRPDNATIFMVGDITLDEAMASLETAFGDWQAPSSTVPTKNIAEASLPEQGRVIIMDKPGSPQSLILAGHLFPSTGADAYLADEMATDILGGEFTSRVNMNLREDKGWAYGAFTFTTDARGQRMWLAYAPVQTDKTMESLAELNREISGFIGDNPATQQELDRIVRNRISSLPGQFETANSVLGSLLSNDRFGRGNDYVPNLKGRYEGLTIGDVQAQAQAGIDPTKLTWVIVGDRAEIEDKVRSLGLGSVEVWDINGNKLD